MTNLSPTHRRLLDIQGFEAVDDETLARTQHWLRFAPGLCALIASGGTALASPWLLWTLAAMAVAGAILPFHPFDLAYKIAVRRISGGPALPENGAPRRFACALGSAWLVVTGALFMAGYAAAGYALGGSLVAVAVLVTTTHICIPSIIFRTACGQMPSLLPRQA